MRLWILLLFAFSNGYPVFDTAPANQIVYHDLANGIKFAWKLTKSDLVVSVKIPIKYKWFVFGFVQEQNMAESENIEEMAWIRMRASGPSIKSANWYDDRFTRSSVVVWNKVSTHIKDTDYRATLRRSLEDSELDGALKFVYGYGLEKHVRAINEAFKYRRHIIDINLTSDKSLHTIKMKPALSNATSVDMDGYNAPSVSPPTMSVEDITSEYTKSPGSLTTHSSISPKKNTITKHTTPNSEVNIQASIQPSSQQYASTTSSIKSTGHLTVATIQQIITTPCPAKCNCTNTSADQSHWYDVIKEKENAVYFAIIGGCALFTGIIVLCIACCCARTGRRIPRTRKHKVAFYKVDDFDSDAEEEMEFIEKGKGGN